MVSRIEQKAWIIKKESVRGVVEANAAGGRSLALLPGSEMNFVPNLLTDEKVRKEAFSRIPAPGSRVGTGTLEMESGADKLNELMLSLFGDVATDQPDFGGAPTVFRHRFTASNNAEHPSHTIFADRGAHAKKYEGVTTNQMTFNTPTEDRFAMSADVMFKREVDGEVLTPDFTSDFRDLLFSDAKVFVAGLESSEVAQASVVINNNSSAKKVLAQTRDAVNIIAGRMIATGSFTLYFENDTERQKFIDSQTSSIRILLEGDILEGGVKSSVEIDVPFIRYGAGAIGEIDGTLTQDFDFIGGFDAASGYDVRGELVNLDATV